jgi:4-hydroxybenzoate polyprenyltransferase
VAQPPSPSSYALAPQHSIGATATALAVVRELRPKQWLKNGLVFFGLVYSLQLFNPSLAGRAFLAFVVFSAISSAGYIFNDIRDAELDRLHPTKRLRPIAAGQLSPVTAAAVAGILMVGGFAVAVGLGLPFTITCAAYVAVTVSYSLWWKNVVLIDSFSIAAGFVLRAVAGAVVIDVPISPWLYLCTLLGSLVIALGKRRSEIQDAGAEAHRPALEYYTTGFLDQLILLTATASVMAYSLYTFFAENVPRNQLNMLTIPVVLYGVFRYLFLVQVRGKGGSPEDLLLGDRSLAASVVVFLVMTTVILYVPFVAR